VRRHVLFGEHAPRCRGQRPGYHVLTTSAMPRFCAAWAGGAASDSNSSLVRCRKSCLATVRIKPVSLSRYAGVLCHVYLSDDVASPSLPPHLAPGVRRCSTITLRLGGAFEFIGLPPSSFVANNETLQQEPAHPCTSGWNRGNLFLPSFPPLRPSPPPSLPFALNSPVLADTTFVSRLNAPQMARTHGVVLEAEEAVAASARRYAPSISNCLAPRRTKRFTKAPSRYGQMRKCAVMSQAAMKAMRSQAESKCNTMHLEKEMRLFLCLHPILLVAAFSLQY